MAGIFLCPEIRDHDCGDEQEEKSVFDVLQMGMKPVEVISEKRGENRPKRDPKRRAQKIIIKKGPPGHPGNAGGDSAELPQTGNESRGQDDFTSVTFEEALEFSETVFVEKNIMPVAQGEAPPAEITDGISGTASDGGRQEAEGDNPSGPEMLFRRKYRRADQEGFSGKRDAEIFEEYPPKKHGISVPVDERRYQFETRVHGRFPGFCGQFVNDYCSREVLPGLRIFVYPEELSPIIRP